MKDLCFNLLQFLIFTFCLVGFIWIIEGELAKYFEGVTSTSTSLINDNTENFPDVIFCSSDGMKDGITDQDVTTFSKVAYDQNSNPVNVKIRDIEVGNSYIQIDQENSCQFHWK